MAHITQYHVNVCFLCFLTYASLSCLFSPFLLLPALAGCNPKQQPGSSEPSSRAAGSNNRKWRNNGRLRGAKPEQPGEEEEEARRRRVKGPPSKFKLWREGPNFDTDLPQDVLALRGRSAFLTCRVFDRTNSTVSTTCSTYSDS